LALLWAAALAAESAIFLPRFFGPFNSEPQKFHVNHVDLLEACAWLRPRLAHTDAVYCTSAGMSHPYIYTLVALGYDPAQWFADPKSSFEGPLPNGAYNHETIVTRYGKMRFMIARSRQEAIAELNEILTSGRHERLVLIVRPGELAGLERRAKPALEIRNPEGEVSLQVFEIET
jgi:hypothetical protein